MLRRLHVQGFKSLHDVEVEFAPLTVLFGPNAGGKSNLLDALQVVPRLVTLRTGEDTLLKPIRGLPIECFAFPKGGVAELLGQESAQFSLEIDLKLNEGLQPNRLRYRVTVGIQPRSGGLALAESRLGELDGSGKLAWYVADVPIKSSAFKAFSNELLGFRSYYLDPRVAMRTIASPAHVDDIGPSGELLA